MRTTHQQTTNQNWLITGASQGFGHALSTEVLRRGGSVVAAVRDTTALAELAERYPDTLTAVSADLREPGAADRVALAATQRLGTIDVLVNNAGRAIIGAAEEVTDAELRELMDLNFFAAAALVRAVLPGMRARGHGTILQMSSQGGRLSFPGAGTYSATKFALEGWSEALAGEVAQFGVRVVLIEPSRFRTGFNTAHSLGVAAGSSAYDTVLAPVRADMTGIDGRQEGDPMRAATILADLAGAEHLPLRLPLGAEAVQRLDTAYRGGLDGVRAWAELARSADFPAADQHAVAARPV